MNWLFPAALALTGAMGVVMALWGLWYLAGGAFCWKKAEDYGWHPARTKFAVLIAARNEELVIGPLINGLLTQNYPPELYDIWVIPNNCTDNTAEVSRQAGAIVYERFNQNKKGKGYALDAALAEARADAEHPSLIICKTHIGFGSSKADSASCHGSPLGVDVAAATCAALEWHQPAFSVPDDIAAAWDAREAGKKAEAEWQARFDAYRAACPELAAELKNFRAEQTAQVLQADAELQEELAKRGN